MSNQKGISFLYFFENEYVYRLYLLACCDSIKLDLYTNERSKLHVEYFVYEGIDDLFFSFSKIPKNLEIFKNQIKINETDIFTDLYNFTYIFKVSNIEENIDTIYNLQVKMNNKNYSCDIEIGIYISKIYIIGKEYKCLVNRQLRRINNIKSHNLNQSFSIENNNEIEIYFSYIDFLPKGNELIFYYKKLSN